MLLLVLACALPPHGDDAPDAAAPDSSGPDTPGPDTAETGTSETDSDEYDRSERSAPHTSGETDHADDFDGDGHAAADAGGDDCDDADPSVHPGAVDPCDDDVDSDCDGQSAPCVDGARPLTEATTVLLGSTRHEQLGTDLQVGDFTGDGRPDVGIASLTTLFVFAGPVPPGELLDTDAGVQITGFTQISRLASGDPDGDGQLDLAIGQPGHDIQGVRLYLGPLTATRTVEDVQATVAAEQSSGEPGIDIAFGDVNADGIDDLAIGDVIGTARGADDLGAAYIFLAPPRGPVSAGSADVIVTGDADLSLTGAALRVGVDLSGDGVGDAVIGAPGFATGRASGGALYVCTELSPGTIGAADCAGVLRAETGNEVGAALDFAGDVDGDGLGDLAAVERSPDGDGAVVLLPTPLVGTVWVEDEPTRIVGLSNESIGSGSLTSLGDLDEDGFGDLAFTGPGERSVYDAGMLHVAFGPFAGTISAGDAGWLYYHEGDGNSFRGSDVAEGEVGLDGLVDLLVTAPDTEPDESGVAWVLSPPTD